MNKKGMTLIELVVAMVIIAIAFYALIMVLANLAPRAVTLETINDKSYLAQEKMEEYLSRSFTNITSVGATSFPGILSSYKYQIVVNYVATADLNTTVAGPTNYKNIKVRVWGGPISSANTVEIVSLMVTYEVR